MNQRFKWLSTLLQLSFEAHSTGVPQARLFEGNGIGNSTRYLSDGSYVRLKTATLSYTLPTAIVSKAYMNRVRLS